MRPRVSPELHPGRVQRSDEVRLGRLPVRASVGDLVRIDGSPHAWFEDRGPSCTLIPYVDDATTRLLASGFFAAETTAAHMRTTRVDAGASGGKSGPIE